MAKLNLVNGVLSSYFASNMGVRLKDNLSPFLFAVFINDLESFLSGNQELQGVECVTNATSNTILF